MKKTMKQLAMTAMLLSSTSGVLADDYSNGSVGDIPGFGEDAYFADGEGYASDAAVYEADPAYEDNAVYGDEPAYEDDASYENDAVEQEDYAVSQVSVVGDSPVQQAGSGQSQYAPVGLSALQPTAYHEGGHVETYFDGGYGPACSCESGCDGGCDSGCDSGCAIRATLNLPKVFDCNTWATYEALLWFPQSRDLPILVASADAGQLPILSPGGGPTNDVTALFGGDIDASLSAGFRADYGKWISKNVGIGGRFWWLGDNGESYSATGLNGADGSIGRPFFEINPLAPNGIGESALLIAYTDADSQFVGDVSAESSLEMLAAEIYGRFRLGSSACHQLDFIGGYSHFRINDKLNISSSTTTVVSDPLDPPPGTVRTFNDMIEAENRFHGGQLGFELSASKGCWSVRSLTKVHLGNMQQRYNAAGSSTNGIIGNAPAQFDNVGMLVQGNNSGATPPRDVFAFAPEANFKLAYRFRPNVSLSVGYSFIYFDKVATVGSVIDRNIDGPLLGSGNSGTNPAFVFDDDSLFVHGIDLGAVIDF